MKKILGIAASYLLMSTVVWADTTGIQKDNTEINKRDRNENEVTADQQSMSESDTKVTQMIRDRLTDDKSLSLYAHNIKIISIDGVVTLKGPVRSMKEKRSIGRMARAVVGTKKVKNELDVETSKN